MKSKIKLFTALIACMLLASQIAFANDTDQDTTQPDLEPQEVSIEEQIALPVEQGTEEDLGLLLEQQESESKPVPPEAPSTTTLTESQPQTDTEIEEVPNEEPEQPQEVVEDIFDIQPDDKVRELPQYTGEIPQGYKFLGWNTDKEATHGYFKCKEPKENIVLYGIWEIETQVQP